MAAIVWGSHLGHEGDAAPDSALSAWVSRAQGLFDTPGRESSAESFLLDLDASPPADRGEAPASSVRWVEDGALTDVAAAVLEGYRGEGASSVTASGYLDLHGNAWAAMLRGSGAWVDLVLVTTRDDTSSEVRVVRLTADRGMGER